MSDKWVSKMQDDRRTTEVERLRAEVERLQAQARLPEELVERLRTAVEFDLQEQFGGDLVKRLIEDVLAWHEQGEKE